MSLSFADPHMNCSALSHKSARVKSATIQNSKVFRNCTAGERMGVGSGGVKHHDEQGK